MLARAGEDVHVNVNQTGVTNRPERSTVFTADAGSMRSEMAAILPFEMAISRTAEILFLGSMRRPLFSSRSYAGWPKVQGIRQSVMGNSFFTAE